MLEKDRFYTCEGRKLLYLGEKEDKISEFLDYYPLPSERIVKVLLPSNKFGEGNGIIEIPEGVNFTCSIIYPTMNSADFEPSERFEELRKTYKHALEKELE
jgi:hypothetical protein